MATWKRIAILATVLCLGAAAQGCYVWPDYYGPYYDYGYHSPTYTYWGHWWGWDYGRRCYSPPPRHHWRPGPGRHDSGRWGRPGSWGHSRSWSHGSRPHSGRSWSRR